MPTPRSKPAQKQEPEIHLNGDIHVHVYDQGTSVAVDQGQAVLEEIDRQARQMPIEAGAPVNGSSSPRMRFDVALEQLSTACDYLEDRINLLYLRTEPLRIQAQDSMPGAGPSGFANDESSNMMQMMNSIWHRVMIAGNRIDSVCSDLET